MRTAIALDAACGSAKVLVLLCPAEPIRPQRVVRVLPACETSQNLPDVPSTNSKERGLPAATARTATGDFGGVPSGSAGEICLRTSAATVWGSFTTASARTPT